MKIWIPWHFHSYYTVGQIKLSQWIFRSNDKFWLWTWSSSKDTDWCNLLLNRGTKKWKRFPSCCQTKPPIGLLMAFPGGLVVKNLPANAGDTGSIPGLGRSPWEGNGNLLQYSCLENPMDWGGWRATVHWVAKSQLNNNNQRKISDRFKLRDVLQKNCTLHKF